MAFLRLNTGDQAAHSPIEIDHHGGDWEGVEVVLNRDLAPVRYRSLGHTTIDAASAGTVHQDGTHFNVYSEPGGHASHFEFRPSDRIRVVGIDVPIWINDLSQPSNVIRQETWSKGLVTWPTADWRAHRGGTRTTSGGLLNVGEKTKPLNDQVFVKYSGLWGSLGDQFSGYWGPAYNETQMAADGFITAWCYCRKASKSDIGNWRAECYPTENVE